MTKEKGMISLWFLVPLVVLIAFGGFTIWQLWSTPEPPVEKEPAQSSPTKLVATRELQPFTKLKKEDLKEGTDPSVPTIAELEGRYLLVKVDKNGEVKREMVAPREATSLLGDAVVVGVQPTSLTTIGGQLQAGDMVDVVPIGDHQSPKPFENVLVLNVINASEKGSGLPVGVTLAIPSSSRAEFAAASANGGILVTRKILVAN